MRFRLWKRAVIEYATFDSRAIGYVLGVTGVCLGYVLSWCGASALGFAILAKVHRSALSHWASARVQRLVRNGTSLATRRPDHPVQAVMRAYVSSASPTPPTQYLFDEPERLLRGNAIVLKSPGERERGVLYLYYSHTYQIFARFFDLAAIAQRYYVVVEPSWSGYCDPQVLLFTQVRDPVFVGAIEPRDEDFVAGLDSNLVVAPFSGNTWVDHRRFVQDPDVEKDVDVVMVSGWAWYKRHWAVFRVLRQLRRRGHSLKVALAGYPLQTTRSEIEQLARHFGVLDQLEIHERVNLDGVSRLYNRAKVNLLWSRREGVNRSIIEGMFCGVPCILRDGFNYGHRYPYINSLTGRYATEASLADDLIDMVGRHRDYAPRGWVLQHMTCERTTERLNAVIKARALSLGETWTRDLVVKTNDLDGLRYWTPEDADRFDADRAYIRSVRRA